MCDLWHFNAMFYHFFTCISVITVQMCKPKLYYHISKLLFIKYKAVYDYLFVSIHILKVLKHFTNINLIEVVISFLKKQIFRVISQDDYCIIHS